MKSIVLACALALGLASNLTAQTAVPCAAPVGMAPTVTATASAQTVTVSWSALRGAVGYAVIRKNPDATCWNVTPQGTTATSLQESMLPGGNYEYQVAVQLIKGQGLSELAPVTVMPSLATTTPLTVALAPAPATVAVMPAIPAGPPWFSAGSDFPAHIRIAWPPVDNASAYRPYRSDDGVNFYKAGFWKVDVWPRDPITGGLYGEQWLRNAEPVTHWFGIKAVFINGRDTTESMMSPVAAVQSVPNVPPSGVQYTVTPSTVKPGSLRIGLSWNASYPAAIGYHVRFYKRHTVLFEVDLTPHTSIIVDEPGAPGYTVGGNLFFYSFRPNQTVDACVYTRYYSTVIPNSPPSCVTIQL